MKRNTIIGYIGVGLMFAVGFFLYAAPSIPFAFASTTSTAFTSSGIIITGYAVPNAITLGYGLIPFILPIVVMGLFATLAGLMQLEGETNSFVIKFGLLVGCLLGMLSLTSTSPTLIPIALPIDAGLFLLTYVWKKV